MPVIVTVGGQFSGSFDLYASRAENFPAGDPLGSSCNLETGTGGSEHGAMPSQPGCKQGCFEAFPMQGTTALRMPQSQKRRLKGFTRGSRNGFWLIHALAGRR